MKNNITLIGMPGAGKSTVGVVLAKVMGYRFVDSDLVIQEKTGKLLSEIIADRRKRSLLQKCHGSLKENLYSSLSQAPLRKGGKKAWQSKGQRSSPEGRSDT